MTPTEKMLLRLVQMNREILLLSAEITSTIQDHDEQYAGVTASRALAAGVKLAEIASKVQVDARVAGESSS